MITVSVESAKASFFRPDKVIAGLDRAEARFMARFGAFVRSDSNRSMRKSRSGRPSPPGSPPRAHDGQLKRFNFFFYDPREHDVVIGPIRLPNTRYAVPGLHEHGGTARPANSYRIVSYPVRPFMRPAFNKNLRRVAELRDSVRK